MKKLLCIMLSVAMSATLMAGCGPTQEGTEGTSESGGGTGDTIKIAVAGPMTGDNAEYGKGFLNASELMVEQWNANGGVLDKQIEIVSFDDKNTGEEAASIAQKIVADETIAGVIGHFSSGVCMVAAPTYQENQVIEISPSASHPDYSKIGDYIFRNNTVISAEAEAALDIAVNDLGKKNIGIISIKTDWGTSTSQIMTDMINGMSAEGVKLVAHEEVIEGSDDYSPAITKLNEAGADVVICVGMYNLVAPVARQYKQVNPEIEIVGFSNAYSQQLLELGGDAVNGVCFPVIFFSGSDDPATKAYVDTYTSKYGDPPSALTSQAYDSTGMLLEAIKTAGSTDPQAVRDALATLQYNGITGETKFDEQGDVQKEFVKIEVVDGQFQKME